MSSTPELPREPTLGDAVWQMKLANRKARQVAPSPEQQAEIDAWVEMLRAGRADQELADVIRRHGHSRQE